MIKFYKVQTEEDIKIFADLEICLAQYHEEYARRQGINDSVEPESNYERTYKHIFIRDSFLIKLNNTVIGIMQTEIQTSEIDMEPILYVHALYFCEKYRNKGLGGYVLKFLCNTYNLRIECSCWYDIPASHVYEKIGFKKMYTRYFLPLDNQFYDSTPK